MQRVAPKLPNSIFEAPSGGFEASAAGLPAVLNGAVPAGQADAAVAAILPVSVAQGDLWSQALHHLGAHLRQAVIETWMRQIVLVGCLPDRVFLGVPDDHYRDYLQAHYLEDLKQAIAWVAGQYLHVELIVIASLSGQVSNAIPAVATNDSQGQLRNRSTANPRRRASDQVQTMAAPAPMQARPPNEPTSPKQPAQGAFALDEIVDQSGPISQHATQTVSDRPDLSAMFATSMPTQPFAALPTQVAPVSPQDGLAARFTFDQFVKGEANQLALSVAQATAQHPGESVNPVFFYGGIGLGKTHLLYAIAQQTRLLHPQMRVRYVPAETFIEDTIHALRSNDLAAKANVRNHYRNVDMLLIDDVQFLQNKDKTQDEFFHTFNALFLAGKQIVLSCDRFPSELQSFHERLRSRFEHGLTCGISPPDRALRQAILHKKAELAGVHLPLDVILYLADHLRNNVRELEGGLHKLTAHSRMTRRPIDLALARSVLGPLLELPGRNLTIEVIQRVTAQHYGLKMTDLKGSKRHRSVVVPRMIATYLARKHTHLSYPDIGRAFGGRDHSTAMHACQKIDWLLQSDAAIQAAVQALETDLGK